jgi:hypothetical protein
MPAARAPATPPRPAREKETSSVKRSPVKAKSEKPRREKTGERPAPKKEPRPTPPEPKPPAPPPAAAPPPKKGGSSVLVWLVVPLLAVLGVGGYIAWDVYTEQLKAAQLQAEHEAVDDAAPAEPEKSREVKVGQPEPDPVEPLPVPEKAATPDKKKKPVADKPKAAAAGSAGAKALAALKADYGKLVDEGVQKKFKLKLHALETEVDGKGDDPAFVSRVNALHEQVKAALESQQ